MEIFIGAVVIAAVAGLIVFKLRQKRRHRIDCADQIQRAEPILRQAIADLYQGEYIAQSELSVWKSRHAEAMRLAKSLHPERCLRGEQLTEVRTLCNELAHPDDTVREINRDFVKARIFADRAAFDRVEKYPLTDSQRKAIVTSEDTTLVIAGAGTGKTSTIVGKVDYLIRRALAKPDEILVLAFGKKASDELKDRLKSFGSADAVQISTFHALGYHIVGQVEGRKPSLSVFAEDPRALGRFMREQVRQLLTTQEGRDLITRWFAEFLDEPESGDTRLTPDERIRREQAKGLRALDGSKLKSRQEVKIANWLTLNGIDWKYERPYPVDTATPWKREYKPDFFLPEYDVYIEHFGIDEQGNTASHVDQVAYREAMEWKRTIHRQHQTTLIETYSYFEQNGGLTSHLSRLLDEAGVVLRPLTQAQIDHLTSEANRPFSDFVNLLVQFLTVMKGASGINAAWSKAKSERDHVFLDLFSSIYQRYEAELASSRQIDFNDMIGRARSYVESRQFKGNYKFIIVDEFQDISENRLGLIQALRAQVPHARIFAVGDDWQCIYRFTGSDVNLIAHLSQRVGAVERVDLDTTFRFRQELADASAAFVTKNPLQLKKTIRAHGGAAHELPITLMMSSQAAGKSSDEQITRCLEDIERRAEQRPLKVFLLGRYNFSAPEELNSLVRSWSSKDIRIEFHTAHSSKGKEADFVIVVGLESGDYGFPSNVSDDPVMNLVLSEPEDYAYAEERRLFYVAITRARRRTYLLAPQDKASLFIVDDLLQPPINAFVETIGEISQRMRCPRCGGHTIRRVEGQYGAFWACSHYPTCHGRLETCPACRLGGLAHVSDTRFLILQCTECKQQPEICPRCRTGYLSQRTGRNGNFLGCSNWNGGAGCTYTANLPT